MTAKTNSAVGPWLRILALFLLSIVGFAVTLAAIAHEHFVAAWALAAGGLVSSLVTIGALWSRLSARARGLGN